MPSVPRLDQLTDFARNRALRTLGGRGPLARPATAAVRRAGGAGGARLSEYARLLWELDHGHQPSLDTVTTAVRTQLVAADAHLARGHHSRALRYVDRALRIAYHPSTHYGPLGSPLMLHADAFLAPLRASTAAHAALFSPDPARERHPGPVGSADQPRRVVVLCHSSWTFVRRVIADLEQQGDVEFRVVDVSTLPLAERPTHALAVRMRGAWNRRQTLHRVPSALVADLQWADTLFVEWGTYPFTWTSFLDLAPYDVRLVARIHRFEVLTPYPLLARSDAFDEIAFVSPPLRRFLRRTSPRLAQAGRTSVVRNVHDLERFSPGPDKDRHRLVQVGWATPIKGVDFSLDVLERLLETDADWRLTLVGPTLTQTTTPRTEAWAHTVQRRLDALGDAVDVVGFRDDVPRILADAGFLLSSSGNEGTHESVAEAAAAGCIPVVRDWPEIAPWGGAELIYPSRWVVADVEAAAERITAHVAPNAFEEEAARCRRWVLEHRDPEAIRDEYRELLGAPATR